MWPTHWMLPNNYEGPSMRKSYSTPRIIKLYSAFEPQKIKKVVLLLSVVLINKEKKNGRERERDTK